MTRVGETGQEEIKGKKRKVERERELGKMKERERKGEKVLKNYKEKL